MANIMKKIFGFVSSKECTIKIVVQVSRIIYWASQP